jgi:NhaA family Na+:H+ antiporter
MNDLPTRASAIRRFLEARSSAGIVLMAAAVRSAMADRRAHATRLQLSGVALLCGTGFPTSIAVTLPPFAASPPVQPEAGIGVLGGSLLAGMLGVTALRTKNKVESAQPKKIM